MSRRARAVVGLSWAVYVPLAALGVGWAAWRAGALSLDHPEPWLALSGPLAHALSATLGLALAAVTIASTRWVTKKAAWARALHQSFREILGGLPRAAVLMLALASGVGEEAFFRLGMQPTVGWVLTSLIFGAVHVGPDRRFWVWTVWAMGMGLLLGAIYEATGSLVGPVLAHVVVNYVNLRFIVEHDPRPLDERPATDPKLVARSERR